MVCSAPILILSRKFSEYGFTRLALSSFAIFNSLLCRVPLCAKLDYLDAGHPGDFGGQPCKSDRLLEQRSCGRLMSEAHLRDEAATFCSRWSVSVTGFALAPSRSFCSCKLGLKMAGTCWEKSRAPRCRQTCGNGPLLCNRKERRCVSAAPFSLILCSWETTARCSVDSG